MTFDIPKPNRILVRGVNWLGDAVMTTPALTRLRERFPDARISLLTKRHLTDLWRMQGSIDAVIELQSGETLATLARRLREHAFDLGVAFPNSFRTALELRMAGIAHRVGYEGNGRRFLLNHRVQHREEVYRMRRLSSLEVRDALRSGRPAQPDVPTRAHHIHHYLHLVSHLGASDEPCAPTWSIPDNVRAATVEKFGLPTDRSLPVIGINAGAEFGPAKRWPTAGFRTVIRMLHDRMPCRFILFGGPGDLGIAAEITDRLAIEIAAQPNARPLALNDLCGRTSLPELAAALSVCDTLVSNDTGPTHLAAAVGTPVIVPFGSTSPVLTGPGLPGAGPHRFLSTPPPCAPCFRPDCPVDLRCLKQIEPERVVTAVVGIVQPETTTNSTVSAS
jgi:heptosyltransferase-2